MAFARKAFARAQVRRVGGNFKSQRDFFNELTSGGFSGMRLLVLAKSRAEFEAWAREAPGRERAQFLSGLPEAVEVARQVREGAQRVVIAYLGDFWGPGVLGHPSVYSRLWPRTIPAAQLPPPDTSREESPVTLAG